MENYAEKHFFWQDEFLIFKNGETEEKKSVVGIYMIFYSSFDIKWQWLVCPAMGLYL